MGPGPLAAKGRGGHPMLNATRAAALGVVLALAIGAAAAEKKEFRYRVTPGATVSLVGDFGPITLRPASGAQVIVTATPHSDKVEVYCAQNGNRVDVRTHVLQKGTPEEGSVDYDLQVPRDASITIRTSTGPVKVQNAGTDLNIEGDTSKVEITDISNGHFKVRTVSGEILLTNVRNSYLDVSSVSGPVTLDKVSGKMVAVNTTASAIQYSGDFAGGGEYSLSSHSGNIDVSLPTAASVDITARSVSGSVQNDFPFRPPAHPTFAPTQGRSLAGTANSGASSVRLRTFSGTIRVKKQ